MVIGQIWLNANPELRDHLRTVNEARSAAFYATWRAATAPVRGLIEKVRRARRERETYGSLSRLNDRTLQDIGLSRSEIGSVAQAVAATAPEAGLTLAELRQTQSHVPVGRDARVVPLSRAGQRRYQGASQIAPQSATAAAVERDRAAA
ncbi:MAG: DUF1127 domain-containing protein [Alphaproteobacteria bacterium]